MVVGKGFLPIFPDIHNPCQTKRLRCAFLWGKYTRCLDRRINVGSVVRNTRQTKRKALLCEGESQIKVVIHLVDIFTSANNGILSSTLALGQTLLVPTKTSGSHCFHEFQVSLDRSSPPLLLLSAAGIQPRTSRTFFLGGGR